MWERSFGLRELQTANQEMPKVRAAHCRKSRGDGGLSKVEFLQNTCLRIHTHQDHLRGDSQDDLEKNRAVMSISLATNTNTMTNAEVTRTAKSPIKTSQTASARLEAFTNLTKKKRRERRMGKSPRRAFAKEADWQELEPKTVSETRN